MVDTGVCTWGSNLRPSWASGRKPPSQHRSTPQVHQPGKAGRRPWGSKGGVPLDRGDGPHDSL
eukprot:8774606-Alexandrium_andersonii.AAC.1